MTLAYRDRQACECGHGNNIHARKGKERHDGECVFFDQLTRKFCKCREFKLLLKPEGLVRRPQALQKKRK
jgi:hypothetical protein